MSNETRPLAPPGSPQPATQAEMQQMLQSLSPISSDQWNAILSIASSTPPIAPPAALGQLNLTTGHQHQGTTDTLSTPRQSISLQAAAAGAGLISYPPTMVQTTPASASALTEGSRHGPSSARVFKSTVGDIDKEIEQRMGTVTPSTRIISPITLPQGQTLNLAKHATRSHALIDENADSDKDQNDRAADSGKPHKKAKGSPRDDFRIVCKAARFVNGCETKDTKELHALLVKLFPVAMEEHMEYTKFQPRYKAFADRVLKEIIGGAVGRLKPGSAGSRYLCDVVHTAVKENGSWIDVDVIRPFFFCTYDGSGNPKAPEENTDASKYCVSPLVLEILQSLQATKGDFLPKAGQLAAALEEDSSAAKDRNDVVSKIVLRWKEVMAACLYAGLPHYVKANNGTLQATNPLACDWEALSVAGGKAIYDEISDVCSESTRSS
ncbi:hypothetical protein BCR44DRAFT_1482962 [Catenaria anguillulae PL171]|uniref:Uncharacterized protein n=1 Tax=Catenaria anguillulae PL171 TaxID=765915 RepID=A0A1Y2HZN5_9FUNG|nr:hypothetical protein BCR44DRAFT_1482962 [Catenaria anguillulae PL171]